MYFGGLSMFYLEDEKTLVFTNENKKDILSALKLINNISDCKNINTHSHHPHPLTRTLTPLKSTHTKTPKHNYTTIQLSP